MSVPYEFALRKAREWRDKTIKDLHRNYIVTDPARFKNISTYVREHRQNIATAFYDKMIEVTKKITDFYKLAGLVGLADTLGRYSKLHLSKYLHGNEQYQQLAQLYSEGKTAYGELHKVSVEIAVLQNQLSTLAPDIIPALKQNAQKKEIAATVLIAGAFTGLLAYFMNFMTHPTTTGYAILPDYGLTSILLSAVVIGALVVVFKKSH